MNQTKTPTNQSTDRGDNTRAALIEAALVEFSQKGFHAASNRNIAHRAQANQALIAYHFGGKEGLYLAVFQSICERIQAQVGALIERIETRLDQTESAMGSRQEDIALLLALFDGLLRLFVTPAMEMPAQLILREQQSPTKAFDILYGGFMQRALDRVTAMVRRIRPDYSHEEAFITVATLLGQALVFRVARATLLRYLDKDDIDSAQLETIIGLVKKNVRAILGPGDDR